jgi:hypothetical protein
VELRLGSPERLQQEVAGLLKSKLIGLPHALLAALPVNEVVTTNYDTLFEQAHNVGYETRQISVLPYEASSASGKVSIATVAPSNAVCRAHRY